jgi:CarD family transcriptional regulator
MTQLIEEFNVGDTVVYPTHGVGQIIGEEQQSIGTSDKISVYVISISGMVIKVPKSRARKTGLRHISSANEIQNALDILKQKPEPKKKKGNWPKQAQQYNAKINSGCVVSIAEVIRDLYRGIGTPNGLPSYSEKVLFETACERFIDEYSRSMNIEKKIAHDKIMGSLTYKDYI